MGKLCEVTFFIQRASSVFADWRFDIMVRSRTGGIKFQFTKVSMGRRIEADYGVILVNLDLEDTDTLILDAMDSTRRRLFSSIPCAPLNESPQYYNVKPVVKDGSQAVTKSTGTENQAWSFSIKASELAKLKAGLPFIADGEVSAGSEQTANSPVNKRTTGTSTTQTTPTETLASFSLERTLTEPMIEGMRQTRSRVSYG